MPTIETLIGTGARGSASVAPIDVATSIDEPFDVTLGPDGHLYFCAVGDHTIRAIDLHSRTVRTIAGIAGEVGNDSDGPARAARLNEPYEIRFDAAGHLVFVDMKNHAVRRIDQSSGEIETIAGTGEAGFSGDGGPATNASFNQPHSIEIMADGSIWIADIGNHRLRSIDPMTSIVTTIGGDGSQGPTVDGAELSATPLNGPRTMAVDPDGTVFLALREGNQIYRIDTDRTIHRIGGTGEFGYAGDGGAALDAQLAGPKGITADAEGIYFADTESHTVRRIDRATGTIHTVIGDGTRADGRPGNPRQCQLARPHGVCIAPVGLFVGDSENHRIRWLRD